ncbi:hypothetical protein P175DRAFT_0149369 [Aspergillus ochraceoroseus IBT 24754]|uniref:Zn(2)-C6 fungal-type domain-containing protein n=1 Tax=Aspergillus ochraceoroseus IBT 24754 TaxID=1392256 RepID=A0A2T5M2Y5_9EURO|nr:uncharacterized protein P175DRAFT_0149369 [Aspergillus ochraceoroseus IBT 24754]PTU22895.1 hypothetical protein P175DRAFT_0149369 [Aspergillus ochraceoroseus IBT 24754]
MVFCGKPSKGCGECRSRKIRCDQGRPTCSQCAKGNRFCPGYRDELSLMFRDESQQVVRKAKTGLSARRTKKPKKPARAESHGSTSSNSTSSSPKISVNGTSSSSVTIGSDISDFNEVDDLGFIKVEGEQLACKPLALQPSYQLTDNEAVSYFIRHNVWPGAIFMMDFEPKAPAHRATLSEQAQMASLVSVGTAMLSRVRQSVHLALEAERGYGHALTLLTRAVCNEKESKANATLSAVLLLAIFEVITSRAPKNIEKWTNHIYGAIALLEIRGPEHLSTEEGLKLFIQLRFQIIISCLQRGARVPQSLLECSKIAMYLRPQIDAYCDRLIYIAGKLSNLRADINSKILTDANETLSAAYAVEAELLAWVAAGPTDFSYTTFTCASVPEWVRMFGNRPFPYNNQYHVYRDLWICHTWNQYRCSRVIVCEIILSCLRRLSAVSPTMAMSKELQGHCAQIRQVTRELAQDICASAVYHLGVEGPEAASYSVPASYCYVGGMLLLWPLTLAGATEPRDHPLRRWVRECLRVIGHSIGIDQALAIIDILEAEAGVFEGMEESESGVVFRDTVDASVHNRVLVGTWNF